MDANALQRGAQLHSEGRLDEAEAVYRTLLDGPSQQSATAHYLLGLLATDQADLAAALGHYDAALALGAASDDLFFRRAEALRALGRPDEAVESYDRAVAMQPALRHYWNNRGVALEAAGRLGEAVASQDQALKLDGDYVQAHHNRGSALLNAGLWEDAIASLNQALARNADIPETWNLRAVALANLELYAEALGSADRALALRPSYPEAHNNRSVALRALKQPQAALASAEAALRARPGFAEALNSQGSALVKLNRYHDGAAAYRAALAIKGEDAAMNLNLGMALEALGDLDGAQVAFAASESSAPDLPDARFARGLVHIRKGEIGPGFALYETRWTQKGGPRHAYPRGALWLGEEPLGERTLLVHAEQGFGDVIQFCRFAPLVGRPEQVILRVQPALKRLLISLEGIGRLCGTDEAEPAFDLHIPIMSLPLALGIALDQVTPKSPYLHAPAAEIEAWTARLPPASGLRVGLAWSGNPGHDNDRNRSMALATLRPLLEIGAEIGVQFVSLQKDYRDEDLAMLDAWPQLLRVEEALKDFADTAALIAVCDLVIAVDTATAHLAGALAKPMWLMLPRPCDWRWMDGRDDSPWHPSAALFRQTDFGDWTGVVDRVAARLRATAPGAATRSANPVP